MFLIAHLEVLFMRVLLGAYKLQARAPNTFDTSVSWKLSWHDGLGVKTMYVLDYESISNILFECSYEYTQQYTIFSYCPGHFLRCFFSRFVFVLTNTVIKKDQTTWWTSHPPRILWQKIDGKLHVVSSLGRKERGVTMGEREKKRTFNLLCNMIRFQGIITTFS